MVSEPELLLAPEFFTTWAADHPSVAGLEIQVKRGSADNELNRYRYDVIVHKDSRTGTLTGVRTHLDVDRMRRRWADCTPRLTSERPAAVRITEIPRAGLVTDVHIEQALAAGLPLADALAQGRRREPPTPSPPNNCTASAKPSDTSVAVTWGAEPGTLDAVFITA